MSSLVLELQRAAMEPDHKVSDLLRKAMVVATKLHHDEFKQWCEQELAGYDKQGTPSYRRIHGQLKAWNPYNGWIPVILATKQQAETLTRREIGQPIGELEELYHHSRSGQATFQVPLPDEVIRRVFGESEEFRLGMVPTLLVDKTHIYGILDAVRNVILQWSLELEQKGILGEGMTFSKEDVEKASHITYNIQSFTGILGNVISSQVQVGDYGSIASDLERLGIPEKERRELKEILERLPDAPPTEKPNLMKRGVDWVSKHAAALGTLSDTIRGWFETLS